MHAALPSARPALAFLASLSLAAVALSADDRDRLLVGLQADGRILVPTNQILKPAGRQVTFPGRPVDLALADDGRTVVAKCNNSLIFLDRETGERRQTLVLSSRGSSKAGFSVVGLAVRRDRVYASDSQNHVRVAERQADGSYAWADPVALEKPKVGGEVHPAGLAWDAGGSLWVTSTRGNCVQ